MFLLRAVAAGADRVYGIYRSWPIATSGTEPLRIHGVIQTAGMGLETLPIRPSLGHRSVNTATLMNLKTAM